MQGRTGIASGLYYNPVPSGHKILSPVRGAYRVVNPQLRVKKDSQAQMILVQRIVK